MLEQTGLLFATLFEQCDHSLVLVELEEKMIKTSVDKTIILEVF